MSPVKGQSFRNAVTQIPAAIAIFGALGVLHAYSPLGNFTDGWGLVTVMVIAALVVPMLLFIESEGSAGYSFIVLCALMVMAGGLSLVCLVLQPFTNGAEEAELLSNITSAFGIGFFTAYLSVVISALVPVRSTKPEKGTEAA